MQSDQNEEGALVVVPSFDVVVVVCRWKSLACAPTHKESATWKRTACKRELKARRRLRGGGENAQDAPKIERDPPPNFIPR